MSMSTETEPKIQVDESKGKSENSQPELSDRSSREFLDTLPCNFNCLVGTSIRMNSDQPQDVIESDLTRVRSLGQILGITDYNRNMASFWFLDVLALQVLRYKDDLDDHYRGVLISWLTGEMKLIRDKKYEREEFFKEMASLFNFAVEKMSECDRVVYWDEIVERDINESVEDEEQNSLEEEVPILKETESQVDKTQKSTEKAVSSSAGSISASLLDPMTVLNIVIDATYETYASNLRYALICAVFVEPIEIKTYRLPYSLRTPRPVKLANLETSPFSTQLQSKLKISGISEKSSGKLRKKNAKDKKTKVATPEIPATPPHSLTDEEVLTEMRRFILPLCESNEASALFSQW